MLKIFFSGEAKKFSKKCTRRRTGGRSNVTGRSRIQILVTREEEKSASLGKKIAERGGDAVLFPTITTRCLVGGCERGEFLKELESSTWVVFTSARAFSCLVDLFGPSLPSLLSTKKIAVVGNATKRKLSDSGLSSDLISSRGESRSLGDELVPHLSGDDRVFFPRARKGRRDLIELLEAQGFSFCAPFLYETIVPPYERDKVEKILETRVDYATFTSPSTFEHFLILAGQECAERYFKHVKIAVIGMTTASEVERLGFFPAVVPPYPDVDALLDAVWEDFASMRR